MAIIIYNIQYSLIVFGACKVAYRVLHNSKVLLSFCQTGFVYRQDILRINDHWHIATHTDQFVCSLLLCCLCYCNKDKIKIKIDIGLYIYITKFIVLFRQTGLAKFFSFRLMSASVLVLSRSRTQPTVVLGHWVYRLGELLDALGF